MTPMMSHNTNPRHGMPICDKVNKYKQMIYRNKVYKCNYYTIPAVMGASPVAPRPPRPSPGLSWTPLRNFSFPGPESLVSHRNTRYCILEDKSQQRAETLPMAEPKQ